MKEFVKWISVLDRNFSSYLDKQLEGFGINSSQYFYIFKICESPGITQDRILQTIYRNPSNITRALAQLEARGYVRKEPSRKDKRTCHLYPTRKAEEDCDKIRSVVEDCAEEVFSQLSCQEREVLSGMVKKAGLKAYELNEKMNEKKKEQTEEK